MKLNILFYLSHPAHFHLFKNVISSLIKSNYNISVLIKQKDVLEDLIKESDIKYKNIMTKERKDNIFFVGFGLLNQGYRLLKFCYKKKIDVIIGTSPAVSHVGFILRKRSIIVNEDDAAVVPLLAKIAYPFATSIVSPDVCDNGNWENKSKKYKGYHELAYLHPSYFTPNKSIVHKYFNNEESYFIIRFSKLGAHHDRGIEGINDKIAFKLVKKLKSHGKIIITSERKIHSSLEKYRMVFNPKHMHDIMAFASLYIGDSQTMAAEAGVLGIPFIRFNDFVGKIGYLNDLENNYKLGFGIKSGNPEKFIECLDSVLNLKNRKYIFRKRRDLMLNEKIDVVKYFKNIIISE